MAGRPKLRNDLARLTCLTPEDAEGIFSKIASGVALYRVAALLSVSVAALSAWIEVSPDRRDRYKRARVDAASRLAEQTVEIADGPSQPVNSGAPDTLQESDVARDKLRIQSRQWLASRWDKETYGDNKQAQVTINLNTLHLDALRRQPIARPVCSVCNVDPCRCTKRIE